MVLGIESSCDETGAAVVSATRGVLGESLASQTKAHAMHGGVVPDLARDLHERAIDDVVQDALDKANVEPNQLSAVAVTIGPGLSLCLKVGVAKARSFAFEHKLPLIPVHHMEAHALVARMPNPSSTQAPAAPPDALRDADDPVPDAPARFPFVCVLASGGHNLVTLCRGVGRHDVLGVCLDDAMGEAFEKTARLLKLDASGPGGGGAALEQLAAKGNHKAFPQLPVPLRNQRGPKTCDFSFAGLKTAARIALAKELGEESAWDPNEENASLRADLAAGFQRCAIAHLEERAARACDWASDLCARDDLPPPRHLVLAGGVAANAAVRAALGRVCEARNLSFVAPPPRWCTDNGVMVAWCGAERLLRNDGVQSAPRTPAPEEGERHDLRARWPLGNDEPRRRVLEKAALAKAKAKRGDARAVAARISSAKKTPYQRRKRVHAPLGTTGEDNATS